MSHLATTADTAPSRESETASGLELIIAGAGTYQDCGLLEVVVDLIQNRGLAPESLMVVALTDGAARELTTRIRNRLNALGIKFNANVMYAGTILSLCLRLLEEHHGNTRMKRNTTVMDPFDQHYFIFQRLDDYRALANSMLVLGHDSERWAQAQTLLKRFNAVTEQAPDATQLAAATHPGGRALAACYRLYLEHLERANALDFSTAQLETLRLLERHPEVATTLKSRLCCLIVDARQENSIIKDRILRCLVDSTDRNSRPRYRFHGSVAPDIVDFPRPGHPGGDGFRTYGLPTHGEAIPWWLS